MFVLLILFGSYKLCSAVAFYLRAYAPTNIALDYFRSRRGLKWALPAALVAHPGVLGRRLRRHHPHRERRPRLAQPPGRVVRVERHQVRAAWPLEPCPALRCCAPTHRAAQLALARQPFGHCPAQLTETQIYDI